MQTIMQKCLPNFWGKLRRGCRDSLASAAIHLGKKLFPQTRAYGRVAKESRPGARGRGGRRPYSGKIETVAELNPEILKEEL